MENVINKITIKKDAHMFRSFKIKDSYGIIGHINFNQNCKTEENIIKAFRKALKELAD